MKSLEISLKVYWKNSISHNMETLIVQTIYPSFMGECNIHGIGAPCTFIRLSGCNLRCYYKTKSILCDTPEALTIKGGKEMSVYDILSEVRRYGRKVVCLTGGEPLMQDIEQLLINLSNNGYKVVIETNGSKHISAYRHIRNVSFVVDVKSSSSGESEKMLEENYELLDENDFVKFVIDTEEDLYEFKKWLVSHDYLKCNVSVGLFWGSKLFYRDILNSIVCYDNRNVYLNMQAHKMICLYDADKDSSTFYDLFIPKEL